MCCAEETYWAINRDSTQVEKLLHLYLGCITLVHIYSPGHLGSVGERTQPSPTTKFCDSTLFLWRDSGQPVHGGIYLCCSHIQLESLGVLSGSFPPAI